MLIGQKITVAGAGIGGLAVALACALRGAKVEILEKSGQIVEVGAGLQISPNGLAVLDALGVGDAIRAAGVQANAVHLLDYRRGRAVAEVQLNAQGGRPYLFLHRADLIEILHQQALATGVQIRLGSKISHSPEAGAGSQLVLADGTALNAPLLIGADGLNSQVRAALNGDEQPRFTGQVAWRALVPAQGLPPVAQVFMGPGRHVVVYPLRQGSMANVVAVQERHDWVSEGWTHFGDPDELRDVFSDFASPVRGLLDQVNEVRVWGLFQHPVARHWYGPALALVGDAAHPTLPFLAQGANMALEDAWVLADCLSQMPQHQALPAYQARRALRVKRIVAAARANARRYHLSNPVVRFGTHSALRLGSVLAPSLLTRRFDWVYAHDVTKETSA